MSAKQKLFPVVIAAVLVVVFVAGASGVWAQNNGNGDVPSTGPTGGGWYGGMGMMGMMRGGAFGPGWMQGAWVDGSQPVPAAIAEALGLDVNALVTELQSGKTIAELAQERGIDLQTIYDAGLTVMADHLKAAVEGGYLTQQQADAQLAYMRQNIGLMPMFNTAGVGGFGPCPMAAGAASMPHMGRYSGPQNQGWRGGWMGWGMHR